MSTYFYGSHQQHVQNPHPMMQQTNHHGRSRRSQRMSSTQPSNRQYRQQQQQHQQQQQQQQQKQVEKVVVSEAPGLTAFRARFEAGRSFDLDDDLEFCPNLLTWDEVCGTSVYKFVAPCTDSLQRQSVTSGSSDRSSLSSGSPENSPLQHQIQPHLTPSISLSGAGHSAYVSPETNIRAERSRSSQRLGSRL